jgi:cell division protein FtsL
LLLVVVVIVAVRLLSLHCPMFSVNFLVVDIKDAISMMAVDIVAGMAIEYDNIYRVACARK